jgi:metal-sulfur cluster biosynthetic enzyme
MNKDTEKKSASFLEGLLGGALSLTLSNLVVKILGLIYKIDLQDDGEAIIDMTLTAPNCPAADFIMEDVRQKIDSVEGVSSAVVNLVFEPEWDKDMMSEEAKLDLGFL